MSAREIPAPLATLDTPAGSPIELPREWRYEPKYPDLDFMYHKPEVPPLKLEDMYAKRRLVQ
jgi:hypothetical protein